MKYEAPELTALTPAIDAVRASKTAPINLDSPLNDEAVSAYQDWE
jgi:hypothetical protein